MENTKSNFSNLPTYEEGNSVEASNIIIEEPEILEVFYQFIAKFGRINPQAIYQAYQANNIATAKLAKQNSYAILQVLEAKARGESIQRIEFIEDNINANTYNALEQEVQYSLQEAKVELEIFAPLLFELQRSIQLLMQMFTHPRGLEYFFENGIVPLYATKIYNEISSEKEKKAYSGKIIFTFTYYSKITLPIDTFSTLNFITKNTDVLYS